MRKNKEGVQLWGPSGAAVWSSPTVDLKRGAVYVTTGDSYSDPPASTSDAFVAFDLKTGKLLWSRQTTAGDAFTVDCGLPDAMRTNCPEAKGPDFDFGSSPVVTNAADLARVAARFLGFATVVRRVLPAAMSQASGTALSLQSISIARTRKLP